MWIQFNNHSRVQFVPMAPLDTALSRMYKHLQYVELPWRAWDSGDFNQEPVAVLVFAGQKLGIDVDATRCKQQSYLNFLHELYETHYDGNALWLDYHELIHVCEKTLGCNNVLTLDHRQFAGPLQQPFDRQWMLYATTQIPAGTVFARWAELGKTPYGYWKDGEPQDVARLCQLAKPWLILRGAIHVSLQHVDFLQYKDRSQFESWWQRFEKPWCDHWQISSWSLQDQYSVIPIGRLADADLQKIKQWLYEGYHPTHVGL